uniref:Uncharacterized protein n=1 Tax=Oryza meridionalis TaxID=40149 RepID=A0A0E0D312_9ORYZ
MRKRVHGPGQNGEAGMRWCGGGKGGLEEKRLTAGNGAPSRLHHQFHSTSLSAMPLLLLCIHRDHNTLLSCALSFFGDGKLLGPRRATSLPNQPRRGSLPVVQEDGRR